MMQLVIAVAALLGGASCQFLPEPSFSIQPPPVQQQQQFFPQQQQQFVRQQPFFAQQQLQQQQFVAVQPSQARQQNYAHRAVVQNAEREAQLPPHLLNPFYKNQRIAGALAKESWFTPGENLVVDREAEKIPRQKIYSVLKNAGFVNRRRR